MGQQLNKKRKEDLKELNKKKKTDLSELKKEKKDNFKVLNKKRKGGFLILQEALQRRSDGGFLGAPKLTTALTILEL